MSPTPATPRPRWLVLLVVWAGCLLLLGGHAAALRDYVALLDGLGRRGDEAATPPQQFVPARHADAQMWVRHTLAARAAGTARVRYTDTDNAPTGREVHWSSSFRWLVGGAGHLRAAWTGEAPTVALERALPWFNVPLLLACLVALSGWAACRDGTGAGVLVAAGMVALPRFYDNFAPMNVDHHGVIAAALLGLQLGIVCMGAGWWQAAGDSRAPFLPASPEHARPAAIVSAICGAIGLWISAASTLPAIAICGLAGVAAAWGAGNAARAAGARFEPALWRCWGRTGGALSTVFYLIEYAPSHLGLRLEVNHPLYAAAWWGGAELVAALAARRHRDAAAPPPPAAGRLALALAAVLAPLVAITIGGTAVFALRDPFIADLRHFVIEGQTLPTALRRIGFRPLWQDFGLVLAATAALGLAWRLRGTARLGLLFLALMAAAWAALTFAELRWVMMLGTTQVTLAVFLAALLVPTAPRGRRLALLGAIALGTVLIGASRIAATRDKIARQWIAEDDGLQLVFRHVAHVLRASEPSGDLVVLASPNASMSIGYYAPARTLGTLFWENAAGLKAAAEIFCARSEAEAAALIRARGITHVALVSNGLFLEEYFRLLHPAAPPEGLRQTFGYQLFTQPGAAPRWLQPVPYRWRVELEPFARVVLLFKVAFDQTETDRLLQTALTRLARDDVSGAEQIFELALAATPADQHAELCAHAGAAFYDYGADAVAVRLFRRALAGRYEPGTATTVAWILASTANVALRDGRAALALLEPQLRDPPDDPAFLSAFAAATAEVGRFPEAIRAAQRAVDLARAANDQASLPLLQRRLDTYRQHRPWRQ